MLLKLIGIYLKNTYRLGALRASDRRARRRAALLVLGCVFLYASLFSSSSLYCALLMDGFTQLGSPQLLLSMMMAASGIVVLITTLFGAKSILFAFRDYDILMSLPIPSRTVVASRVGILYLTNLFFTSLTMIPSYLVFSLRAGFSVTQLLIFVLLFLFSPVIPIIIGTFAGSLLSLATAGFRKKNLLGSALSIAFLAVYLYFSRYFGDPEAIQSVTSAGGALITRLGRYYPPVTLYTDALAERSWGKAGLFSALSVLLLLLFVWVVGRVFQKINTALTTVRRRGDFRMKSRSSSSQRAALFRFELRRYLNSTIYFVNTAFGVILALLGAVALFFMDLEPYREQLSLFAGDEMREFVTVLLPLAAATILSLSGTTCSSLSIEGKTVWQTRSLPIGERTLFGVKMALNLVVTLPFLLAAELLLAIRLSQIGLSLTDYLLPFLLPVLFAVFIAAAGLFWNLLLPKYHWQNEAQVVKQSASVLLTMLTGMIFAVLPLVFLFLGKIPPARLLLWDTLGLALLTALLLRWLFTAGVRSFRRHEI